MAEARVRRRHADERGNALVLMPTAVLIMFVLASLAVDTALTFSAQRQVADLAAGIANDAASAIVEADYYGRGRLVLDPVEVRQRARASRRARTDADDLGVTCEPTVAADRASVTVRCVGRVTPILAFVRFLGGEREVGATVTAFPAGP